MVEGLMYKPSMIVRITCNSLVAAILGGSIAYLAWLLGAPQWLALLVGASLVALYGVMWLGSMDDSNNA